MASGHFGADLFTNLVRLFLVVNVMGSFLDIQVLRKTTELAHFLAHVKGFAVDLDDIVLPDLNVIRIVFLLKEEIRSLTP